MFTGIIEAQGVVREIQKRTTAVSLSIDVPADFVVAIGDSVAVNGVCLTVTTSTDTTLSFDIMAATYADTTLGSLHKKSIVNLERALLPTTRLGGHFVSGHVDVVGEIVAIGKEPNYYVVTIRAPQAFSKYLIPKGSIAIDGISLTVQNVARDTFSVGIIPHTFSVTTLSALVTGSQVNLEFDMLAKYIENINKREKDVGNKRLRSFLQM